MQPVDAASLDLNLLKALAALLAERSVTRASLRLGVSQPAASRALGRLRRVFGDPLLVRSGAGMGLTPRAESLATSVTRLLEDIDRLVSPPVFDPATASGRLTLAAHDHLSLLLLPPLVDRVERLAPGISLQVQPPAGDNVRAVEQGAVDLALGIFASLPGSLHRRTLYEDRFVCVVRQGHACARTGLDLATYLSLRHIAVSISGVGASAIDHALAELGEQRHVPYRVAHFLTGAAMVVNGDMAFAVPGRLAARLADLFPIAILPLPLDVPPIAPAMIWHGRFHAEPAHTWLRQQLVDTVATSNAR